jgi:hypothetical protein
VYHLTVALQVGNHTTLVLATTKLDNSLQLLHLWASRICFEIFVANEAEQAIAPISEQSLHARSEYHNVERAKVLKAIKTLRKASQLSAGRSAYNYQSSNERIAGLARVGEERLHPPKRFSQPKSILRVVYLSG